MNARTAICFAIALLLVSPAAEAERLSPSDFVYVGAFRLPVGAGRPKTFEYGGTAMTFRADGDPGGAADGFAGSLFVVGHVRLAYGELPTGSQLAEISIPRPSKTRQVGQLPRAKFLQRFHDVAKGRFKGLDEIPRIGLQYLNTERTGPAIHIAWGQHFQPTPAVPSHGYFRPDLSHPDFRGEWFIAGANPYSVNGYLFDIPKAWAHAHVGGRRLATGRFRDGGWSGLGPSLHAYWPWDAAAGRAPPAGARIAAITLLQYPTSRQTTSMDRALEGYQHPDEWEGGAWIATAGGKTAVLFAGTKGVGAKYWYGFVHPKGPDTVCVHGASVGQFPACRLAGGGVCPSSDMVECAGHNDSRGWWSQKFVARFLLYDPADFAKVAAGTMKPWQPQPYAHLDVDRHLFLNPENVEPAMLGTGPQRRFRIGGVAYDRANGRLYVIEPFADGAQPVVHVWQVR